MQYRAEIFDKVQYLFDKTGFNDHQLHGVIRFKGRVDAGALENAFVLLVDTAPVLSRVFRYAGGDSFWEDAGRPEAGELFSIAATVEEFEAFTFSATDAEAGPQIKGCLLQGRNDALSIVGNHMITDGAGFKECLYLLSRLYSNLVSNAAYRPDFIIDGDRGYKAILSRLSVKDRLYILFNRSGDNNAPGAYTFPLSTGDAAEPFILTHELAAEKYRDIVDFSKKHDATVNDVILAAYYRVLSVMLGLNGAPLSLPLMIDMRRYMEDKSFRALANYASTEIIKAAVRPGEDFTRTLENISALTKAKKDDFFGLNSFIKLQTLFRLFGRRSAFRLLERGIRNPNICVTNIGVVDDQKLVFQGVEVLNAIVTGSIKYRPHFQMSLSSYRDRMTLAVNLYGSDRDREKIGDFFAMMDHELEAVSE